MTTASPPNIKFLFTVALKVKKDAFNNPTATVILVNSWTIFKAIKTLNVVISKSKFSFKNFTAFAVPSIVLENISPKFLPNSAIAFLLSSADFLRSPKLLFNASKKPLETSTWKIKKASFMFDIVPNKVWLKLSIKFPNFPPVPNAFESLIIDSSTLTLTPAWKPAIAVTALSLNRSAEPIPALNDFWIFNEAWAKSPPIWTAVLPVILSNSSKDIPNSSALSLTVAKATTPFWISLSSNGVPEAKSVTVFKAFLPSFALPIKAFNWTSRFSIWIPALTKPLITVAVPKPINAFLKLKTDLFKLPKPDFTLLNTLSVLLTALILNFKFFSAICLFYFIVFNLKISDPTVVLHNWHI